MFVNVTLHATIANSAARYANRILTNHRTKIMMPVLR
jgi:hypothetical protein